MSESGPDLPKPTRIGGCSDFWRSQVEDFRDKLFREALAERLGMRAEFAQQAPRSEPDSLVPAKVVAAEFVACQRTLGRRIYEPSASGDEPICRTPSLSADSDNRG